MSLESVRGIVSIVAGLLCSVLLFASLYFLVDSGADISYVAGSLIGIIACVDATQEVGYSFGQIINGALSVQQFRRVCDSDTYDHASEIKLLTLTVKIFQKLYAKMYPFSMRARRLCA